MPFAVLKSIREVTSEDKLHCAANLLQHETVKKWKTGEIGEKSAYVIIEMETEYSIKGIDIGNESSAFVEVLVGGPRCARENFKEILITCSFMTPGESKAITNTNRVRCFNRDGLVKEVADEKWNLLKIVCTQPFNKHIQYGLSFIKIHVDGPPPAETKKSVESNGWSGLLPKPTLAGFKVRDDSPDSESESAAGLFRRWKTAKASDRTGTSSIPRNPSPTSLKKANDSFTFKKANDSFTFKKATPQTSVVDTSDSKESSKLPDRNRDSLVFDDDDETALKEKQNKRLAKLEKIIQADKDRLKKETDNGKKPKKRDSLSEDDKKQKKHETKGTTSKKSPSRATPTTPKQQHSSSDKPSTSSSAQRRPSSSPCLGGNPKKPKLEKELKYKPFHQLLDGVVLVISGIQNPGRADLRTKALALGAKYKPDWDSTCTHLICAFKNTPKYNQVQGLGKIVTRKWIEDCHTQKKRLPWRRYALDTTEQSQPESEDEILEEAFKPKDRDPSPPPEPTADSDIEEIYDNDESRRWQEISSGSDTEDEIEHALASTSTKKLSQARDVFDLTTEEEDYMSKLSTDDSKSLTFFKNMKFFVSDQVGAVQRIKVEKFIEMYHGELVKTLAAADYAIANTPIASGTAFKGQIVKPLWILECNDAELLIPINRYLAS